MIKEQIPTGWQGGFPSEKQKKMLYPTTDLTSLPMLGNMDNINLLQRQWGVKWPMFSWNTLNGEKDPKRCYVQFAPYISRIGYTNEGRIYSIICPQQGMWIGDEICINVEVTVTGQRGWVNEDTKEIAADMMVEGKIWLTPGENQGGLLRAIWPLLKYSSRKYPIDKENAIRVGTYLPGNPKQPIFQLGKGLSPRFKNPQFAIQEEAFTTGHINVEIGRMVPTNDEKLDKFNQYFLDIFNLGTGNMLQKGNVLSWNLFFDSPELVSIPEWQNHADYWRTSIGAHHGSPGGEGTSPRYFDGTYFDTKNFAIKEVIKEILNHVVKNSTLRKGLILLVEYCPKTIFDIFLKKGDQSKTKTI